MSRANSLTLVGEAHGRIIIPLCLALSQNVTQNVHQCQTTRLGATDRHAQHDRTR